MPTALENGPFPTVIGDSASWVKVPSPSPKENEEIVGTKVSYS